MSRARLSEGDIYCMQIGHGAGRRSNQLFIRRGLPESLGIITREELGMGGGGGGGGMRGGRGWHRQVTEMPAGTCLAPSPGAAGGGFWCLKGYFGVYRGILGCVGVFRGV